VGGTEELMNHIEFALLESAALAKNPFESWVEKVEKVVGHDLDGDKDEDGYSLDDAFDCYEKGISPEYYIRKVIRAEARREA
jgi:hypothetical protein